MWEAKKRVLHHILFSLNITISSIIARLTDLKWSSLLSSFGVPCQTLNGWQANFTLMINHYDTGNCLKNPNQRETKTPTNQQPKQINPQNLTTPPRVGKEVSMTESLPDRHKIAQCLCSVTKAFIRMRPHAFLPLNCPVIKTLQEYWSKWEVYHLFFTQGADTAMPNISTVHRSTQLAKVKGNHEDTFYKKTAQVFRLNWTIHRIVFTKIRGLEDFKQNSLIFVHAFYCNWLIVKEVQTMKAINIQAWISY